MSGEGQYINPIIESMANTANLAQKAKAQSEQARANKANEALRQTQLDQELKRIENEHQHAVDLLGLEGKRNELLANEAKIHAVGFFNDLHAKGIDFSKIFPSGQPQAGLPSTGNVQSPGSTVSVPGLGDISPDAFQSPGDVLALEMARARGVSEATSQGALPAELTKLQAENTNKLIQQGHDIASREKIAKMQTTSEETRAKWGRDTQYGIARIENDTKLRGQNLEYGVGDSGDLNNLNKGLTEGALTGEIDLTPGNKREANIAGSIISGGGKIIDKKTGAALKQAEMLIPAFQKMRDFANELPSQAGVGSIRAHAEGAINAGINKIPLLTTDLQNKWNQLKSNIINIGSGLESLSSNRINMAVMNNTLNSMGSTGLTKEQMLQNADNLENMYFTKTQDVLMNGVPDWQKKLIYSRGITPNFIIGAPKSNPAGLTLDRDASIKLGQPAYK